MKYLGVLCLTKPFIHNCHLCCWSSIRKSITQLIRSNAFMLLLKIWLEHTRNWLLLVFQIPGHTVFIALSYIQLLNLMSYIFQFSSSLCKHNCLFLFGKKIEISCLIFTYVSTFILCNLWINDYHSLSPPLSYRHYLTIFFFSISS